MKKALLFVLVWLLPVGLFAQQGDNNQQKTLVFTHVTVIDATGAPAKTDMTVVVKGELIEALGKTGKLTVPQNARVVDATGKFLIPGLWDMHIHPHENDKKEYLALFIANGITGMRVMWGDPLHHTWREEILAGELIGPRMVIASPTIDGPPARGRRIVVSSEEEGRQIVRKVKKEGADFVKLNEQITRDTYFAIADEANKLRIPFVGHLPFSVSLADASDAGLQSLEHTVFVVFACSNEEEELRKKAKELRDADPTWRDDLSAKYKGAADIPYSEKKAAEVFARLVKNSTWVCPTLTVRFENLFRNEQNIVNEPRLKYLPLPVRDLWKNSARAHSATGDRAYPIFFSVPAKSSARAM